MFLPVLPALDKDLIEQRLSDLYVGQSFASNAYTRWKVVAKSGPILKAVAQLDNFKMVRIWDTARGFDGDVRVMATWPAEWGPRPK